MDNTSNYMIRLFNVIENANKIIDKNLYIKGFGMGFKNTNKKDTSIPSIVFIVHKKLSEHEIEPCYKIPKFINGIFTDVVELDKLYYNTGASSDSKFYPKVAGGGAPITNSFNKKIYGTIAYALTERGNAENLYILSCSHILTNFLEGRSSDWNTIFSHKDIMYPPLQFLGDAARPPKPGRKDDPHIIGKLEYATEFKVLNNKSNIEEKANGWIETNVAIAKVGKNDKDTRTNKLKPYLCGALKSDTCLSITETKKDLQIGERVFIISSSSIKPKYAIIKFLESAIKLYIPKDGGKFHFGIESDEFVQFRNQITIYIDNDQENFDSTDEGSLVVSKYGRAIGMVIYADNKSAICTPIDRILSEYNMEFAKDIYTPPHP